MNEEASMKVDGSPPAAAAPSAEARIASPRNRRRLLPRFGLRTLFVFAILFCLFFAWIGRNLYRIRQEETAIETLKQAGATIAVKTERGIQHHPETPYMETHAADWNELPSLPARALGIAEPYPVNHVDLFGDPDDPPQEDALAALATFPELEGLGLHGPAFDDDSLKPIAKLPKLNGMMIFRTKITREGLSRLSKAPALEHLTFYERWGEPDLVEGVRSLPQLRSVQIAVRDVSRADVAALASLPELAELNLTHVVLVGDDAFEPLWKAASVRHFHLSVDPASRPLGEPDVRAIARLPNAEVLYFDRLDERFVPLLDPIDSLKYLRLYHPPKMPEGVEAAIAFSRRRQDVLVEHRDSGEEGPVFYRNGKEIEHDAAMESIRLFEFR